MSAPSTSKSSSKKRSATASAATGVQTRARKLKAANPPPTFIPTSELTQPLNPADCMDNYIDNMQPLGTASIDGEYTMRVYPGPWLGHDEALMIDFVRVADGTRVDGPTDWALWALENACARPRCLPRYGADLGSSLHMYYVMKQGRYEVRRADGSVIRTLSFPPQPIHLE
ncbi:hypothetical protein PLICRDRAFT_52033 [Plicaturopsis crispa FD-325 SS-3]|nr:hypothetical protein PLICRDRAFT_52033 [Plicaturopsis crispa FD-325 SS-3]